MRYKYKYKFKYIYIYITALKFRSYEVSLTTSCSELLCPAVTGNSPALCHFTGLSEDIVRCGRWHWYLWGNCCVPATCSVLVTAVSLTLTAHLQCRFRDSNPTDEPQCLGLNPIDLDPLSELLAFSIVLSKALWFTLWVELVQFCMLMCSPAAWFLRCSSCTARKAALCPKWAELWACSWSSWSPHFSPDQNWIFTGLSYHAIG